VPEGVRRCRRFGAVRSLGIALIVVGLAIGLSGDVLIAKSVGAMVARRKTGGPLPRRRLLGVYLAGVGGVAIGVGVFLAFGRQR